MNILAAKYRKKERGAVLPLVLFVVLFLTLLGYMALMTSSVEVRLAASEREYQQALYVAESGVNHFVALLRNDPAWKSLMNATAGASQLGGINAELNGITYHAYGYDDGNPIDDNVFIRCDATTSRGTAVSVESFVRITVEEGHVEGPG